MEMERWRPVRGLIPWRPLRDLGEMDRRFDDVFGWPLLAAVWRWLPTMELGWAPAIDVFEKEGKFVVKAELPGLKEEDIDISVVGNTLTVKGERKTESEVKEDDYYHCERSYGSFSRSIDVPSNVDTQKIEANYEDGVLEISLPKTPEARSNKISVSAKKKAKASK